MTSSNFGSHESQLFDQPLMFMFCSFFHSICSFLVSLDRVSPTREDAFLRFDHNRV